MEHQQANLNLTFNLLQINQITKDFMIQRENYL